MEILHRAKEEITNNWVHGFFTGTNEFIVIEENPRLAKVHIDSIGVYIGKRCIENGSPIFSGDIVKDHKGDLYYVIFDNFDSSFKLKSSIIYSGAKPISGNLTIVGNLIDDEFIEPESRYESTSITPTSQSSQRRSTKEALRGIGLY